MVSLDMEPATIERNLQPLASGPELDLIHPGLELNCDASGLNPDLVDRGPEVRPVEDLEQNAPQVLYGTEDKETIEKEISADSAVQEPNETQLNRKPWRRFIIASILVLVVVPIVVSVSVTQTRNRSRATPSLVPSSTPSSSSNDRGYSSSGAFKGTDFAFYLSGPNQTSVDMIFQHYTGQIRHLVSSDGDTWAGSELSVIVGSDARNGTPLATGAYAFNNILWIHLFYIDTSNLLQDIVRSNISAEWKRGTLGGLHRATSESQKVALDASWNYGESGVLLLYYGAKDNLIQELTHTSANESWQTGFSFGMSNGNSGVTYFFSGFTEYLICLNSAYQLEIWWKDYNTSSVASATYPVGVWTRGSIATNTSFSHNSSLQFDYSAMQAVYQDPSNKIMRIQFVSQSESAGFLPLESATDALAAAENTCIGGYIHPRYFLQTNESNIVEYRYEGQNFMNYTTRVVYAG